MTSSNLARECGACGGSDDPSTRLREDGTVRCNDCWTLDCETKELHAGDEARPSVCNAPSGFDVKCTLPKDHGDVHSWSRPSETKKPDTWDSENRRSVAARYRVARGLPDKTKQRASEARYPIASKEVAHGVHEVSVAEVERVTELHHQRVNEAHGADDWTLLDQAEYLLIALEQHPGLPNDPSRGSRVQGAVEALRKRCAAERSRTQEAKLPAAFHVSTVDIDILERNHEGLPYGDLSKTILSLCESLRVRRYEVGQCHHEIEQLKQRTSEAWPSPRLARDYALEECALLLDSCEGQHRHMSPMPVDDKNALLADEYQRLARVIRSKITPQCADKPRSEEPL